MSEGTLAGDLAGRKPRVSVCIATFNQQRYIRDAVMSVLAQANPQRFDLEILIGDDASSDETPAILHELAGRHAECLTVITHQPNVGAARNYQALVARASGDYIAHLDGDDCWLPGKLAAQLAYLGTHADCVAVYSNALVVSPEGRPIGLFTNDDPRPFAANELLIKGNFLNHSSLLYRASSAHRLLDLPAPFIDYGIHLGLARDGLLAQLSPCFVLYRTGTATSMLHTMADHVGDQYFTAMLEAFPRVDQRTRTQASVSYLSRALIAVIAGAPSAGLPGRAKKLQHATRQGGGRMAIAVAGQVALLQIEAVRRRVSAVFEARRLPVVHPRR